MKQLVLLIYLGLCTLTFAQTYPNQILKPKQLSDDIALLKNELERVHPDLYLYTKKVKIDSLFAEAVQWSETGRSSIELYRKLAPVIGAIRNNHTVIKPSVDFREYLNKEAKLLPLSFTYNDKKLRILKNYSENKRLVPGSVIQEINGIPADSLMTQFLPVTPTDGFNTSFPIYFTSRLLSRRIACFYGEFDVFEIVYETDTNVSETITIDALRMEKIKSSPHFNSPQKDYTFQIKNEVAILTIPSFSIEKIGNYSTFLKRSFREIKKEQIKKLVIDVRNNGGGTPEASNELMSYLITEPVFPVKQRYSFIDKLDKGSYYKEDYVFEYFNKRKFEEKNGLYYTKNTSKEVVKPKSNRFDGEAVFLINEPGASATTSLLGQLREHTDIKYIGKEAGGNPYTVVAEYTVTMVLPNSKLEVKIPLIKREKNRTTPNNKRGVIPDIEAYNTPEDVVLGLDKVLETALNVLEKRQQIIP